jgi:hypothetical protein
MENAIIDEFTEMINQCRGQVIFVTEDGDRLVADSMLSALVGFKALLSIAESSPLHVSCEMIEDCERIIEFMKKYHLGTYRHQNRPGSLETTRIKTTEA